MLAVTRDIDASASSAHTSTECSADIRRSRLMKCHYREFAKPGGGVRSIDFKIGRRREMHALLGISYLQVMQISRGYRLGADCHEV
jgi:hypothetical protein